MKVSFLCNSLLALQSAQYLHEKQLLTGLATAASNAILNEQAACFAAKLQVPFASIRPKNVESDLMTWMEASAPDLVLVQTFPHLIPASCLEIPPQGFYNLHPSKLPTYRGPDPIFWQIANGESESGVTLHRMDQKFDTGPIVCVAPISVETSDTYGLLQSNLTFAALEAIKQFVDSPTLELSLTPQNPSDSSTHPKPKTEDLIIDWNKSAEEIQALCRACNPHQNGAITFFRDVLTRFLEVKIRQPERVPKLPPGSIIGADEHRGIQVLCADKQCIEITVVHVEEGYFSGRQFCEVFRIKLGEKFCTPAFLS